MCSVRLPCQARLTRTAQAPRPPAARAALRERQTQEAASRLRTEDVREVFRRRRDDGATAAPLASEYGVDAALLERALRAAALPWLAEVKLGVPPVTRRVATLDKPPPQATG